MPLRAFAGRILVHRDAAERLMQQKALQPAALAAVPVLDAFPDGYMVEARCRKPIPAASVRETLLQACNALKAVDRPVRMLKGKEAVKLLRAAKKARREDFAKALPKTMAEALMGTMHAPLLPYYAVANGGCLSGDCEYELLPYERALAETETFHRALVAEALLPEKPEGVVIAACADGDKVLLLADGTVIRFSHEEPETVNSWPSLAQFVADAVSDE